MIPAEELDREDCYLDQRGISLRFWSIFPKIKSAKSILELASTKLNGGERFSWNSRLLEEEVTMLLHLKPAYPRSRVDHIWKGASRRNVDMEDLQPWQL